MGRAKKNMIDYFEIAKDVMLTTGVAKINPEFPTTTTRTRYTRKRSPSLPLMSEFAHMTRLGWEWIAPNPIRARVIF